MLSSRNWLVLIWILSVSLVLPVLGTAQETSTVDGERFFVEHVKPILVDNCWSCHADDPEDLGGNLALTSPAALDTGGESGPAINRQNLSASLFLKAINHDVLEMPPGEKLPAEQIATLTRWFEMGLPWPAAEQLQIELPTKPPLVTEEAKRWWAFQPPHRAKLPDVQRSEWVQSPIDQFVLHGLETRGFQPAPPASRESLMRRAYYDLWGLPPSPAEVADFMADPRPDAYERLIDRLLESPHYGEKWARHWLDLVRYAESNSFERDGTKPFAWRYRDYVIQAFNADKPYDQFVIEQLAGDELPQPAPEALIATGYYRLGQWDDEPADPKLALYDGLDDILATTSQTFLGLTVNCARCHDHKIDPIPQADYYRLLSFFSNIRPYGVRSPESVKANSLVTIDQPEFAAANRLIQTELKALGERIGKLEERVKADFIPVEHEEFRNPDRRRELVEKRVGHVITAEEFAEYQQWQEARRTLRKQLEDQQLDILCVKEKGPQPAPDHVLLRGNPHVEGERVEPGFLSVLPETPVAIEPTRDSSGRRLTLARWIANPDNPLTARVMANRVWQYHFGRGIVRSSSDFGFQGTPPTHPELLDWLARELVDNGWRLKPLHRAIMLSSTYRMSSRHHPDYAASDPENDSFWRFEMRRLSGEEIRDSILAISGQLNRKQFYGRSVFPELPPEVLAGQSMPGAGWEGSPIVEQNRRSIYVHVKRSLRVPLLANFDSPDPDLSCPVRFVTTQPTQALGMLNSQFLQNQAAAFAESLGDLDAQTNSQIVREILRRVWQREPQEPELQPGLDCLQHWTETAGLTRREAVRHFCLLALNLNEFVYLD